MMNCPYCKSSNSTRGDIPIMDADIDMGILGRAHECIYITRKSDGCFLDLNFNTYGIGSQTIHTFQEISYCPACGTKLATTEG